MSDNKKQDDKETLHTVDMYHVRSKWTTILFIAFIVALLIFAAAIFMTPQTV